MIPCNSRVRVRPDNPMIWEMFNVKIDKDVVGEVIDVYQPPPFAHDNRQRWCVKLDIGYYSLFYEHELEVLP